MKDLSRDASYANVLAVWRKRMVDWLSERGSDWVKDGVLQVRKTGLLYSPHYPKQ